MSSLSTLLSSSHKGFLKRVLEGAGLGLGTAGVSMLLLKSAISVLKISLMEFLMLYYSLLDYQELMSFFRLFWVQSYLGIRQIYRSYFLQESDG